MKTFNDEKSVPPAVSESPVNRRSFLTRSMLTGAALLPFAALLKPSSARAGGSSSSGPTTGDIDILIAAEIAEALAVTTYTHIIKNAPFFGHLPDDDQVYLTAAREEEMSHYALEESVTGQPTPYTKFFYPHGMFKDTQTTLNTLVTLEDAFIAAYLVGVRNFSTPDLRVTAARIMGIESDHRTLARSLAPDVAKKDGGPITSITGADGVAECVSPPNNNGYERTLKWTEISQAVSALLPFVDAATAAKTGFDTSKSYKFEPFTPTLPSPLGNFISFGG